ncbi:MAG: type II toxin-antitoxin system VapC family toxin [Gemmatimonadaceae bacterium]|nr:type II toxin-antitoxin system VapC family toxin [Gemmatimonadaceae bacterium]
MRVLLDTHVLIWWDAGQKLSAAALEAIQHADDVYVSVASAWEIAIKASLGKISSKRSVSQATAECGFLELPVTFEHAELVATLPSIHRDPFDRMLVGQAIVEGLTVVTRDPAIRQYHVSVIAA